MCSGALLHEIDNLVGLIYNRSDILDQDVPRWDL
jgi:hypothetical protein